MAEGKLSLLLDLVREYVPPAVDVWLPRHIGATPGRCLPSTRIGLETLRYFGVKAEPLPMRAMAVNARWREWQDEGGEPPMPDEAWSVAVGWPSDGEGIDTHLVLIVESELLLDLDSGQMSRPTRGIHIPPTMLLALGEHPHPDKDRSMRWAGTSLSDDGVLSYVEHPHPPAWKQGKDYRYATKAVGPVIRKVREKLREAA